MHFCIPAETARNPTAQAPAPQEIGGHVFSYCVAVDMKEGGSSL